MGLNRKTPKQAMKYWRVGGLYSGIVIKARTARVAVRKYLRDSAMGCHAVGFAELDNPHGRGEMPHEYLVLSHRSHIVREYLPKNVGDVQVCEVPKGTRGSSAPDRGAFWRGFNRRSNDRSV